MDAYVSVPDDMGEAYSAELPTPTPSRTPAASVSVTGTGLPEQQLTVCGYTVRNRSKFVVTVVTACFIVILATTLIVELADNGNDHTRRLSGTFFHITDLHLDTLYDPTCNAFETPTNACGDPNLPCMCRRTNASFCYEATTPAPYGRYGCDAPQELIENTLNTMKADTPNPSFIVISGDMVAHHSPSSIASLQTLQKASQIVAQHFPGITVIPVLGNNDVPSDYCLPDGTSWWLNGVAEAWSQFLPDDAVSSLRMNGYYSLQPLGAGDATVRILALNTLPYSLSFKDLDCNHTTVEDDHNGAKGPSVADPRGQFAWMRAQLTQAQAAKQRVMIVGHIAPGVNAHNGQAEWNASYTQQFIDIVHEYSDVLGIQLYAHFHRDEFRVFYATQTGSYEATATPLGTALLHASITPVYLNNPSYRKFIYDTDRDGMFSIANYQHYFFDLRKQMQSGTPPQWELEYDFQEAYNQDVVDPAAIAAIQRLIQTDRDVQWGYYRRRAVQAIQVGFKYGCEMSQMFLGDYNSCLQNQYFE